MATQRYKVGVLREWNPSAYSRQLGAELERLAPRYDFELDTVGVQWADSSASDDTEVMERTLETVASCNAMVLVSGVFSYGVKGLSQFAQRWLPRPVVSVGYRLPGVPSLLVDNRGAVRTATSHLIEHHKRTKLLFVRGRRDSQEAEERYLGFRHALRDSGLLHDDRRVLEGEFTRRGAIQALQALDDNIEFDGVVAANDDMALAVLTELLRRKARVPRDVAIVGFDDVRDARLAKVPLSTMAQPFEEMARMALDSIKSQAEGMSAPFKQSVQVKLVSRASCGCG